MFCHGRTESGYVIRSLKGRWHYFYIIVAECHNTIITIALHWHAYWIKTLEQFELYEIVVLRVCLCVCLQAVFHESEQMRLGWDPAGHLNWEVSHQSLISAVSLRLMFGRDIACLKSPLTRSSDGKKTWSDAKSHWDLSHIYILVVEWFLFILVLYLLYFSILKVFFIILNVIIYF